MAAKKVKKTVGKTAKKSSTKKTVKMTARKATTLKVAAKKEKGLLSGLKNLLKKFA